MSKKKINKTSFIINTLIFLLAISIVIYFTYPNMVTPKEWAIYRRSYGITIGLTLFGGLIGSILGVLLAYLKFQKIGIISFIIDIYIDIMRGTPMVLQLLIFSVVIFSTWTNNFYVAVIALGLNSAAYVAEIVRSGIESIDKGQMEAARAIGMPYGMSMNEIILPQAIKNIFPALINEFITLFKETSIVGYISVMDVTMNSKVLQAAHFNPRPVIFTGVIYFISVKIFSFISKKIEERLKAND